MSAAVSIGEPDQRIRERFDAAGQAQVFAFWDRLDAAGRARLLASAGGIDLAEIGALADVPEPRPGSIEPAVVTRLPAHGGDPSLRSEARQCGEELLASGRIAALILAGGQATRLGLDGPKGAFPVGPASGRSLFALHAEKLRRLERRYGAPVCWIVLTSAATDAATRACFETEACYGLDPANVLFVVQGEAPSLSFDGRLMLAAPDQLARSPDGHGGSLPALVRSGALDRLTERGIDGISTIQVDNPLAIPIDPVFAGLHRLAGARMSCKALPKREPRERVGTLARLKGQVRVIEYTEVPEAQRDQRDALGELVFWAGSIGMHVLDVDFARHVGSDPQRWLPLHKSAKTIPSIDSGGVPVVPGEPNGYKLERFVFDALAASSETALLEVRREEEYSPIKNRNGGESPDTARRALSACYRRWLAAADLPVPETEFELDHSRVDGPEDLRALGPRALAPGAGVVRTASGEME